MIPLDEMRLPKLSFSGLMKAYLDCCDAFASTRNTVLVCYFEFATFAHLGSLDNLTVTRVKLSCHHRCCPSPCVVFGRNVRKHLMS